MKTSFKTILLSALSAIAVFTVISVTSCDNDKCKAIVCAYNGVCNDGICTCPSGYEGPQCEKIMRDKFEGIYQVLEKGTTSQTAQYAVSVEKGEEITDVRIKNFRNIFIDAVSAYVKSDTIFIPEQTVDERWVVKGVGIIEADQYYGAHGRLVLRYNVRDLDLPENDPLDDYGLQAGAPSIWNKTP